MSGYGPWLANLEVGQRVWWNDPSMKHNGRYQVHGIGPVESTEGVTPSTPVRLIDANGVIHDAVAGDLIANIRAIFTEGDWRQAVACNRTTLGYLDWLEQQCAANDFDSAEQPLMPEGEELQVRLHVKVSGINNVTDLEQVFEQLASAANDAVGTVRVHESIRVDVVDIDALRRVRPVVPDAISARQG